MKCVLRIFPSPLVGSHEGHPGSSVGGCLHGLGFEPVHFFISELSILIFCSVLSSHPSAQQAIDPDTAHPNLKLSSDNKEMRVSDKAQEVADHPGRYNSVLGALGKTGFQKGRHYWEVTVAGKSCYTVGAASETAQRQGNVRYHPKNQYWTLRLQRNGQLQALDTRTSVLKVPANPDRIGVLVDFKKGDVSFYDAAARTHLYTFSGQAFTSQVFPFMSSCEDTEQGSPPIVFNPVASVDWL
uniref:B30.2/SPRY domain-containing protein n=1 Tax=Denticeps clupeoides TaxID=299321 RepID=A0AAY4B141_9TELE